MSPNLPKIPELCAVQFPIQVVVPVVGGEFPAVAVLFPFLILLSNCWICHVSGERSLSHGEHIVLGGVSQLKIVEFEGVL